MHLYSQAKIYLPKIQYFLISALILILPYWSLLKHVKPLVLILFFTTLLLGAIKFKEIFRNKIIMALLAFLSFIFISALWTPSETIFTYEYKGAFTSLKYYFLLIPAIYSASFTTKQIKNLFLTMALSPLVIMLVYLSNSLGFSHIYFYLLSYGDSHLIGLYLINNFFIMFGALYFYILMFESFVQKKYKLSFVFFILTLIYFISLIIDPKAIARLMTLTFFIIALLVPLFYLSKKKALLVTLLSLVLITLYINSNTSIQKGLQAFKTAISEDKYQGSWGHRFGFAIVGLTIFTEHPMVGRGISDVRERTILFAKENPKYFINDPARHFHNDHINLLVQVGVVGYALFMVFIILFLRIKLKDSFISRIKLFFILSFLLLMMGEHYLYSPQTTLYFAIFIALVLLYERQEHIENGTTAKAKEQ